MDAGTPTLKFIRDPVHDIIRIQQPFVLDVLDTAAMQRLRRIRQLGVAWLVYPGAEHSRFTHSLGVYHLAGRVISQLEEEHHTAGGGGERLFDERRRHAVLAAALLHDVGHGPFSHAFEHIIADVSGTKVPHEDWTKRIIREQEDVRQALSRSGMETITDDIIEIIDRVAKLHYVTAIVSSQLDVDRFDYLLRDSHMTGSQYGAFDLEWMLRTLAVRTVQPGGADAAPIETIVVDGRRGLDDLEKHLIGRHFMYRHVYYHKTIRAAEIMLHAIFKRAAHLIRNGTKIASNQAFDKLVRGEGSSLTASEYLSLNDFVVLSWVEEWARSDDDKALRDLSERLIKRRLLKAIVVPPTASRSQYMHNRQIVEEVVVGHGYDPAHYLLQDEVNDIAFKDFFYNAEKHKDPFESTIWFLDRDGEPHALSSYEKGITIQAKSALSFSAEFWFVPPEVAHDARIAGLTWS